MFLSIKCIKKILLLLKSMSRNEVLCSDVAIRDIRQLSPVASNRMDTSGRPP